jgi:hypothetical protein
MTILEKLKQARDIIKKSDLKKLGWNEYSKFGYFTPEQVEQLVDKACEETKMVVLCNLKADEFGLYQTLDLVDLESKVIPPFINSQEVLHFEMRTKHGSITATNETQQMGGTDTYSERYIKMKVFQIKDNNLDPDSQDNAPKVVKKAPVAPTKPSGGGLSAECTVHPGEILTERVSPKTGNTYFAHNINGTTRLCFGKEE